MHRTEKRYKGDKEEMVKQAWFGVRGNVAAISGNIRATGHMVWLCRVGLYPRCCLGGRLRDSGRCLWSKRWWTRVNMLADAFTSRFQLAPWMSLLRLHHLEKSSFKARCEICRKIDSEISKTTLACIICNVRLHPRCLAEYQKATWNVEGRWGTFVT